MKYLIAILTATAVFALDYEPEILRQEWGTPTCRISTRRVAGNMQITQWENCTIPEPPTDEQIQAVLYKANARAMRQQVLDATANTAWTFDYDSKTFVLSDLNRSDWNELKDLIKNDVIALPYEVSSADDLGYTLTTKQQVAAWHGAGMVAWATVRSRERALLKAIKQAASQADLDTIKASAAWLAHIGG